MTWVFLHMKHEESQPCYNKKKFTIYDYFLNKFKKALNFNTKFGSISGSKLCSGQGQTEIIRLIYIRWTST